MKQKYKYSNEELAKAVSKASSYREVAEILNIIPRGGNLNYLSKRIQKANISVQHFPSANGIVWNKGKTNTNTKIKWSQYLKFNTTISSHRLKIKLIGEGILERICNKCKLNEWMGEPIPIELNHIDGNYKNNLRANLEILCPNCHAQTSNYRGKKNKGKRRGF